MVKQSRRQNTLLQTSKLFEPEAEPPVARAVLSLSFSACSRAMLVCASASSPP
eukprot:CAMPEP_0180193734 /NCGR_PEP_ID=MMETSP0987-20121128/2669_1 /TAXON_ID=697907 /ORGANISM="non described non described, Strain CCMP2293" /LENGTH=52 /DNA_ID=CAMNT_0022148443 /DNA_START=70 /DNA_END=225 /DNA_ORIENTATION=-